MSALADVKRTCACGCGAYLSAYNSGDYLDQHEPEPTPPRDLDFAVLAILAAAHAADPDATVDVLAELRAQGTAADCWTVGQAVQRIRRRFGIIAEGTRGRPGYRITRLEYRFRDRRRAQRSVPERVDCPGQLRLCEVAE